MGGGGAGGLDPTHTPENHNLLHVYVSLEMLRYGPHREPIASRGRSIWSTMKYME